MKFTREIVEKVFENLGKTSESICEFDDGRSFDVDLENEWGRFTTSCSQGKWLY